MYYLVLRVRRDSLFTSFQKSGKNGLTLIFRGFFHARRGFHCLSLTVKVNASGIPQWGGLGISNDWCIIPSLMKHFTICYDVSS